MGIFTFSVSICYWNRTKLFGGFYYRKSDGLRDFHSGQFNIRPIEVNKWVRMSAQCRLNDDVDFSRTISFYIYGYGFTTNSILYIKNVKLEYGNKATDWTPSPEDLTDSENIISRINLAPSGVTIQGDKIDFLGNAVFQSLTTTESGTTVIDGGKIATNSILAKA